MLRNPALESRVPGLTIDWVGGLVSFEAEGRLHGLEFYFRDRGGATQLSVGGDVIQVPLYQAIDRYGYSKPPVDARNFADRFCDLVSLLRRAPRIWSFASRKHPDRPRVAWGFTPEEAWERMHQPSAYVFERGVSPEVQLQWLRAEELDPKTITVDDRIWPDPEPKFVVL